MGTETDSGQAALELVIAASLLIAFFVLALEVSEVVVREQSNHRFQKAGVERKSERKSEKQ